VARVLAAHEPLYNPTHHRAGPPTADAAVELLFPKLRGRGLPRALPPQLLLAAADPYPEGASAARGPFPDDASELRDWLRLPRPLVALPRLPRPAKPTNRDLRLSTALEEEKHGPKRLTMLLPPPDIGV
jgi:hypothetical protein